MKNFIKKFFVCSILLLSISSFMFIKNVNFDNSLNTLELSEINKSTDKLVGSVKAATILMDRVIELLAKHE